MSNTKNAISGLLIFVMNIIYPQIQNVNKVIDTSIKNDNFNGAILLAKKWQNRAINLYRAGRQTL